MILFIADIHIKLEQKNVPIKWAIDRYNRFFNIIYDLEKEVDTIIIGGDIFDKNPTLEELCIFTNFISKLSTSTIIYDGNHEATKKYETFFKYLKDILEKVNPLVKVHYQTKEFDNYSILPYAELHKPNSIETLNFSKPLFTHVRGEIPPHVKSEVDLNRFNKFPVVFAGDLHSHSNTQRNIVYPGSPMTITFHRKEVKTGGLLIDENTWEWKWVEFKLPQLIRKTISNPEEMIQTEFNHTIYELQGDVVDLSNIKNSELLDKKITTQSSEATLILGKDMTVQEELYEYLMYIQELSENKVKNIIGVYNDYNKGTLLE